MALYVLMFEEIFSYLDYYKMTYKSWVSFELVWSWTRQLLGLISLSVKWSELFCYSYLLRKLFNLSLASGSMISESSMLIIVSEAEVGDKFLLTEWGNHQMEVFCAKLGISKCKAIKLHWVAFCWESI